MTIFTSEYLSLGAAKYPLSGAASLRRYAKECGAIHPNRLTSTRLRQQLATMSQALNLSETDQDQLATFMGHDLVVHRKFYRLTENVLQAAKVSKVLHLLNTGKLQDFKGKNYDEITFTEEGRLINNYVMFLVKISETYGVTP
jgi:hypothetical protein